jgi:membrane protein DedA with SNARE-associated domain
MIDTFIHAITGAFTSYPYIFIFIGLIFAGESILLPAIYFALRGELTLSYVVAIALVSTLIADLFWYWIGAHVGNKVANRFLSGKIKAMLERLSGAFSKRSVLVLYLSKFVYGTRIAAHILAGLKRMSISKYLSVNFLGTLSLIVLTVVLSYFIHASVSSMKGVVHTLEITMLGIVAVIIGTHLILGKFIKKIWYQ